MSAREQLHRIIDQLTDADLAPAMQVLESLRDALHTDPLLSALLTATEDDEPVSPQEQAALDQALEESGRGETKPWREVRGSLE